MEKQSTGNKGPNVSKPATSVTNILKIHIGVKYNSEYPQHKIYHFASINIIYEWIPTTATKSGL